MDGSARALVRPRSQVVTFTSRYLSFSSATILSHILDHGNHPRLRILGFRLLLLWLNDQVVEYPECMGLFVNAIPLDLLLLDDIQSMPTAGSAGSDTPTLNEEKELKSGTGGNGLQFVKRINERSTEKAFGHGLDRHERIRKADRDLRQSIISSKYFLDYSIRRFAPSAIL